MCGCATADRERLDAYQQAFDAARDLAEATLRQAEAAAEAQDLDLAADLAARCAALEAVAAYNELLAATRRRSGGTAAADDAKRLARALGSLAGRLGGDSAERTVHAWEPFAAPVGEVVDRLDELLARRRYRELLAAAGPAVEELLRLLADDAAALQTIISGPVHDRQLDAIDELAAVSVEFQRLIVAAGADEAGEALRVNPTPGDHDAIGAAPHPVAHRAIASLQERLSVARAEATSAAGLGELEPLAALQHHVAVPTPFELQRLQQLVERAEICSAESRRCGRALEAQRLLCERYAAAFRTAAEAIGRLRTESTEVDAAASVATFIDHVRWFREAYQSFQESTV